MFKEGGSEHFAELDGVDTMFIGLRSLLLLGCLQGLKWEDLELHGYRSYAGLFVSSCICFRA